MRLSAFWSVIQHLPGGYSVGALPRHPGTLFNKSEAPLHPPDLQRDPFGLRPAIGLFLGSLTRLSSPRQAISDIFGEPLDNMMVLPTGLWPAKLILMSFSELLKQHAY